MIKFTYKLIVLLQFVILTYYSHGVGYIEVGLKCKHLDDPSCHVNLGKPFVERPSTHCYEAQQDCVWDVKVKNILIFIINIIIYLFWTLVYFSSAWLLYQVSTNHFQIKD